MTRRTILGLVYSISFIVCAMHISAQGIRHDLGFKLPEGKKFVDIEFVQVNNLIIIPVTLNRFANLKFILDTGVEHPILFEKAYADLLELKYLREIIINGIGEQDSVKALISEKVNIALSEEFIGKNLNLIVLVNNFLNLKESFGMNVDGVLGYDLFKNFVVKMDYRNNLIKVYDPKHFKRPKKANVLPMKIVNNKPFIEVVMNDKKKKRTFDLMVDTGASHAFLMDFNLMNSFALPKKRLATPIGRGIGGNIYGNIVRFAELQVGSFAFDDVLISSPFPGAYFSAIKRGARIGTLGGGLLRRFFVTFDYPNKLLYLKKNVDLRDPFEFNMCGLLIHIQRGDERDFLEVVSVLENSPAKTLGFHVGDTLISINGHSLENSSFSTISALFRKKENFLIKIKMIKNGAIRRKRLRLQRII